jgi:hypothetical protein
MAGGRKRNKVVMRRGRRPINPTRFSDRGENPCPRPTKIAVAFYKRALFEGRVEDAFRLYAASTYHQHNPLIEDGMEGVKKFVT